MHARVVNPAYVQCICSDHVADSNTIVAALGSQHSDRHKVGQQLVDKDLCTVCDTSKGHEYG